MKAFPSELAIKFAQMFDALWEFSVACKKYDVSPDRALSMILTCFYAPFRKADSPPQWRRDLAVRAVNTALAAMEADERL